MKKQFIFYAIILLLVVISCKKDNEINPIYGKWTVISGGGSLIYGAHLKYIIVNADNSFYFLYEYEYGIRSYTAGLCQVVSGQIGIYREFYLELFNYSLTGNQLILANPDYEITCERKGDEPAKQEWVRTVEILQTMQVSNSRDLAFDGDYLWYGGYKSYPSFNLYKIDLATLSVIDSIPVTNNVHGLEWADGYFWSSSNGSESIYKVDPATGNNVFTSIEMGAWIEGIGYDGQYFWCGSNNENTIYQYDVDMNTIENQYEVNCWPSGIAYINGYLYVCANGVLNKCTIDPFQSVGAYDVAKGEISGVAFDGNDFWISAYYNNTLESKIHKVTW